jgi:hypothetical protein
MSEVNDKLSGKFWREGYSHRSLIYGQNGPCKAD